MQERKSRAKNADTRCTRNKKTIQVPADSSRPLTLDVGRSPGLWPPLSAAKPARSPQPFLAKVSHLAGVILSLGFSCAPHFPTEQTLPANALAMATKHRVVDSDWFSHFLPPGTGSSVDLGPHS